MYNVIIGIEYTQAVADIRMLIIYIAVQLFNSTGISRGYISVLLACYTYVRSHTVITTSGAVRSTYRATYI